MFVARSFATKVGTLPRQSEHHDENNRTANQGNRREAGNPQDYNGAIGHAIEKRNITSANRLRNALKKKVDEVHSLKITVEENRFEAEEDKEGILEWSAQIEERVGEFEKAELANKGFRCAEMETTAKEEEERAEKKGRNSTMK